MQNLLSNSIRNAGAALLVLMLAFAVFEPALSLAVESQFTISQTVTAEVAFAVPPSNVTLSPSISGISGGTSNGGTQLVVTTNNTAGYSMTLTSSSSLGMIGNTNPSNYIPAYVPATANVPDLSFTVGSNLARFGYTVEASTTADLTQIFKDNGSACNAGSSDTVNSCWLNASTSAVTVVNRATQTAASGSTTTLKFRVTINSNPSPLIPSDTYVATTTLTATAN